MDHTEATRLQAAEKYILGELPQALREEYEEHFFDCPACALDIKAAAAFADTTREVLREQPQSDRFRLKDASPVPGGWFGWLRPTFAVPAFAALALLLVVGYQNTVTIPQLKNVPSNSVTQIYGQEFSLWPSAVRRGTEVKAGETDANEARFEVRQGQGFLLSFDFTPSTTFADYLYQLQDASGHVLAQNTLSGESANQRLHLPVSAGLLPRSGKYSVVFFGADSASGNPQKGAEVQRFTFTVAFQQ